MLVALSVLAGGLLAAGTSSAMATCTGDVAQFCSQPATTDAGSSPNIASTANFNYGSSTTDSVKDVTVTLAPGLLASPAAITSPCTPAELASYTSTPPGTGCPAGSLIGQGTVSGTVQGLSGTQTFPTSLYLMTPPDASKDVAGVGLVITTLVGSITNEGTADVVTNASGQPVLQLAFKNLPNSIAIGASSAAVQVTSLSLTFNGTAPPATGQTTGAPFTRLPTNCSAPATTTLAVDTYSGGAGTGSDAFTPTNCNKLAYAPKLAASAVRDNGDNGVTLTTVVTQAAGEAANSKVVLATPSSVLSPNLIAAAGEFGKTVGSASATSPLFGSKLTGTVTLVTTPAPAALKITFPAPVGISLVGGINLTTNAVTFDSVPDIPLTNLAVTLNGGSGALFTASCASSSGTLTGTFTSQSGVTVTDPAPLNVQGCPPPTYTVKPGKPSVSGGKLTGLKAGKPKLSFTLKAGSHAPKLKSFTLSLPKGLSFIKKGLKKGVSLKGAKIKSEKLSHGRLVVTLKSASGKFGVSVSSKALRESSSLKRQFKKKKRKVKSLTAKLLVTDASNTSTALKLKITKLS
jgi:hypothetical protein